jgi:hypothetical protein
MSTSPSFAEIVKKPLSEVVVEALPPFTETVTAGTGLPFSSFTVPLICLCCACTISSISEKKTVNNTGRKPKKNDRWLSFSIAV